MVDTDKTDTATKSVPENGYVVTAGLIQVWTDAKKKNVKRYVQGTKVLLDPELVDITRLLHIGAIKKPGDEKTASRLTARRMALNLGGIKDPARNSQPMDVDVKSV